jgi:Putative addiction module component
MKSDPKKILNEVLRLDAKTRAFIAESLLESPEFDEDFSISQEWLDEIQRRCDEIDSGKAKLIEDNRVISELRDKYS